MQRDADLERGEDCERISRADRVHVVDRAGEAVRPDDAAVARVDSSTATVRRFARDSTVPDRQ